MKQFLKARSAKVSALLEDLVKLGLAKKEEKRTSARKKCLDVYTLPAYKGAQKRDELWMLTLYAKSVHDNIPAHIVRAMKERF